MDLEVQENNAYFMQIAKIASLQSDYSKTKVGAVFVKDNIILCIGYNHLLDNFLNDDVPVDNISNKLIDKRNSYTIHAEVDAILNFNGNIKDLYGSTLYVTISPCHECAKILSSIGVKNIFYLQQYHDSESTEIAKIIFDKNNILYKQFEV